MRIRPIATPTDRMASHVPRAFPSTGPEDEPDMRTFRDRPMRRSSSSSGPTACSPGMSSRHAAVCRRMRHQPRWLRRSMVRRSRHSPPGTGAPVDAAESWARSRGYREWGPTRYSTTTSVTLRTPRPGTWKSIAWCSIASRCTRMAKLFQPAPCSLTVRMTQR